MRDFNFFDPYIKVQAKPKSNIIIFVVLLAFILSLLLYFQLMMLKSAKDLNDDIAEIDTYITSSETMAKLQEVTNKQAEFDALQLTYTNLVAMTMEIEMSDNLDDMLFEQINAKLPEGAFLAEVTTTNQILTIKGYSLEYGNIAQFAYNLHEDGNLFNILIPSITENNGSYMFTITASLGLEVSNEN